MSARWPRVAWALVYPGDRVYAADQRVWDVVERDGRLVVIERHDGERTRRMARVDPPGDVPCQRGRQWGEVVEAVAALRGAGFTTELIGTWPLRHLG